jgi:uncharacterized protein YhbP (UPF0306 family)
MTCSGAGAAVTARPATEPGDGAQPGGAPSAARGPATPETGELRRRVERYLRVHHTMTIATVGIEDDASFPHAASVFYAVDDKLRLVFLSKPESAHGLHIEAEARPAAGAGAGASAAPGGGARVAITVTEQYDDWEFIQGVQMWGSAKRVTGAAKAAALAVYLRRFPFVRDLMEQPRLAASLRKVAVYRVEPDRIAFTDNTTGVFGREVLDLKG